MNQNLMAQAASQVMVAVRASGLLVSLATFQSSDAADFPDGFPSETYADISGLVDLQCMMAPQDLSYIAADEKKDVQTVTAQQVMHVMFGTIYPTLNDGWREGWRVIVDGTAYDVMGIGTDSQGQHSVAKVRLVTI